MRCGWTIPRGPFYGKELDLRLSRSYGPGSYDPAYELHGHDYPPGYVPWTQQRNMEAFLGLVAKGKLDPAALVSHRFAFDQAQRAYEALQAERPVAIVLSYPRAAVPAPAAERPAPGVAPPPRRGAGPPRFGLIGAGSFATARIIPGLVEAGFEPAVVASASGLSAESARQRFGFGAAAAGAQAVLEDDDLELIAIATPHDSHAELVVAALERGRSVYVEKPLALEFEEVSAIERALARAGGHLFVGFNRRYAPLARELRKLGGPRLMSYRVNAGPLPAEHWTNDVQRGGGRLKGEGCHFIDFLCDQTDADPASVLCSGFRSDPALALAGTDNFSLQIAFADGSAGTVAYAADAPAGPGKERFETSAPGAYAVIDDFRRGSIWTGRRRRQLGGRRQDKGFAAQFEMISAVLRGEAEAPSADRYLLSTLATLAAARSLETGGAERVTDASTLQSSPDPAAI